MLEGQVDERVAVIYVPSKLDYKKNLEARVIRFDRTIEAIDAGVPIIITAGDNCCEGLKGYCDERGYSFNDILNKRLCQSKGIMIFYTADCGSVPKLEGVYFPRMQFDGLKYQIDYCKEISRRMIILAENPTFEATIDFLINDPKSLQDVNKNKLYEMIKSIKGLRIPDPIVEKLALARLIGKEAHKIEEEANRLERLDSTPGSYIKSILDKLA